MGTEDIQKQQAAAEKFWGRFANLPAVKDKRIYVIDPDTVLRLGPRISQGAQAVAKCLHPELFSQAQEPNEEIRRTND
jgi:ABC-type Fe3+-hydroxamate transport system substrate-binding protein